ncbi:MAG: carbonic anhydrase [Candidatus Micrarchaeia archaeon]
MRLIISCMDRRLNEYLDSLNDGNTIFLRNGGANVKALKYSIGSIINDNNISEIKVITHTDCGAMKVVAKALNDEIKLSQDLVDNLVEQFRGVKFNNSAELENSNKEIQEREILTIASKHGIKASAELLDISKIEDNGSKREHEFYLMKPEKIKYAEVIGKDKMFSTYVIQSMSLDEQYSDIEIATKVLGIAKGVIAANGSSEYRQAQIDMNRLKMSPFAEGIELSMKKV